MFVNFNPAQNLLLFSYTNLLNIICYNLLMIFIVWCNITTPLQIVFSRKFCSCPLSLWKINFLHSESLSTIWPEHPEICQLHDKFPIIRVISFMTTHSKGQWPINQSTLPLSFHSLPNISSLFVQYHFSVLKRTIIELL